MGAYKRVSANGQISLGKQFAGKEVEVVLERPGHWVVTEVTMVPAHERAFHTPAAKAAAARAARSSLSRTPRAATAADIDALERELLGDRPPKAAKAAPRKTRRNATRRS